MGDEFLIMKKSLSALVEFHDTYREAMDPIIDKMRTIIDEWNLIEECNLEERLKIDDSLWY